MYRFLDESGFVAKGESAKAWKALDPYRLRAEALMGVFFFCENV